MRITESQLRRIIRQEVRALHEMPRRRAPSGGGPFTIATKRVPVGFYSSLYVSGYEQGEVAKAWNLASPIAPPGSLWFAHGPKGVPSPDEESSVELLRQEVEREVKKLGRKHAAEPRRVAPNEATRLELLSAALASWDTIRTGLEKRGL